MPKDPLTPWANIVGKSFAYLQDATDRIIDWGFEKMKQTGEEPEQKETEPKNPYVRGVKKFGKGILFFLGKTGDAYYRKYEELKRK